MMTGSELIEGELTVKIEYVSYIGRMGGRGSRWNKNLLHYVKPPKRLSVDKTTVLKF